MERATVNKENVIIREAQTRDIDNLNELFQESDSLHCTALPEVFKKPAGRARERSFVESIITDPDSVIFVAEYEGNLLGFISLEVLKSPDLPIYVSRTYAKIDDVAVLHYFRGNGIGTMLFKRAHEWAKDRGAHQIELNVYEFNWGAREFYEHMGYRTISRRMSMSI